MGVVSFLSAFDGGGTIVVRNALVWPEVLFGKIYI